MECASEPTAKPKEWLRFRGAMTTGQIWGDVRAIQHTDNFVELSEFGCHVEEGVTVWNQEPYEGWVYFQVEKVTGW